MSTEPAYDSSNVHLAQGQTVASAQFRAAADTGPEVADPDAPIYYTPTPEADAYLAPLPAEPGATTCRWELASEARAPEPEAGP